MNRYAGLLAILIISISIMSIGFVVASDSDSDSDSDSEDKQPDQQTTPATTPTPASTDRVGQILQESNISRNPPGVDSGGVGSISGFGEGPVVIEPPPPQQQQENITITP